MKEMENKGIKPVPKKEPAKSRKKKEPIPEQVIPVSYEDHIKAGFVNLSQSEGLQKQGKMVVEIKNIEGKTLHKLKERNK